LEHAAQQSIQTICQDKSPPITIVAGKEFATTRFKYHSQIACVKSLLNKRFPAFQATASGYVVGETTHAKLGGNTSEQARRFPSSLLGNLLELVP
jgi:hypothetical protein